MATQKVDGIEVEIGVSSGSFTKDLDKLDNQLQSKTKKMGQDASKTLNDISKGLATTGTLLTATLTAPIIAFGKGAIESASYVGEMDSKFKTVFRELSQEAETWATNYGNAIGRSKNEIKEAISNQTDLYFGMGFTREEAFNLSKQVTELGYDLASFNNKNDAESVDAMTKALMGETESAKMLGVNLTDTVMQTSEFTKATGKSWDKLTMAEKAQVRYKEAVKQSSNAMGDAERTQDSFANMSKRVSGQLDDLKVAIGERLLPVAEQMITKFSEMANKVLDMINQNPQLIDTVIQVAGALAGLGPVLLLVAGGFKIASLYALVVASGIGAVMTPVLLVTAGVVALYLAFVTNFGGIRDNTISICNNLAEMFKVWWNGVKANFGESLEAIKQLVKVVWDSIKQIIDVTLKTISGIIKAVTQAMNGDWKGAWNTMKEVARTLITAIKDIILNIMNAIVNVVIAVGVNIANAMYNAWQQAKAKATEVWNSLVSWFKGAVNDPVGTLLGIGSAMYNAGASIFNSIWNGCKSIWNSLSDWFTSKVNWIKDKLTFWNNSKAQMSSGGGGGSASSRSLGYGSRMAYAMATPSTTQTTNITFSGSYNFSNKGDIDYFMQQAGQQMRRLR